MNTKILSESVDTSLIIFSAWYSIENLKTILGIIILVLDIIWILLKYYSKIKKDIKNKDVSALKDDVKNITSEIKDLNNKDGDDNEK